MAMKRTTQRSHNALVPVLLLSMSLVATGHAASAAVTLGPTIDLPWTPAVDFAGGSVAVLADGSFAIASYRYDLGFSQYQVQFFSAAGDLLPPFLLEAPIGSTEPPGYVGVGSLRNSYFVVWQPYRGGDGTPVPDLHAFAQLFGAEGTPLGSPFQWPSSGVKDFALYYRFGSAPSWRFLPITYNLLTNEDDPIYLVSVGVAKPDEVLHRPPIEIAPPMVSNVEDAAINGSGRFVVVSDQCTSYPPPTPPCVRGMQSFDDAMTPVTPLRTSDLTQEAPWVSAAINSQGQVLLNYTDPTHRFVVRLYDKNGSPASEEIRADTPGEPYQAGASVSTLKGLDSSFVLAWTVSRAVLAEALVINRFDPHSQTFDHPVVIAMNSYGLRAGTLALNGHGRGVIVWQDDDAGFFPGAAHLRLITVTP